jgi:YggT family protein
MPICGVQGGGRANDVQESEFALRYLPFWIANYALAMVFWSLIGRFLLGFFVPQLQPSNYVWRGFYWLTEWSVWLTRWITPLAVRPLLMPLVAGFWVFHLRVALFFIFAGLGMLPRLGAS